MIDPLSTAITVAGMILAYCAGRSRRRAAGPKPVKAICPCDHAIGFHTNFTGACNALEKYALSGLRHRCGCVRYAGPELISTGNAFQGIALRDTTTDDGDTR